MNPSIRSLMIAAAAAITHPALATTYTLEPNYTQVVFSWDHLGYSHPTAQIAQGIGMLEFDPMEPSMSSLQVTLPVSSLTTGVRDLDEHLKSGDFFDVARFPEATFRSTKVERGRNPNDLTVTGSLTIRNVTKPLTLAVKVLKIGTNPRTQVGTVGFNAMARLKRSDFGLGAFVPHVGDEIELRITCQGAEAQGQAAYLRAREEKENAKKQ